MKSLFEYLTEPPPAPEDQPGPAQDSAELVTETYPCTSCGKFAFAQPTVCYWCR